MDGLYQWSYQFLCNKYLVQLIFHWFASSPKPINNFQCPFIIIPYSPEGPAFWSSSAEVPQIVQLVSQLHQFGLPAACGCMHDLKPLPLL